MSLLSSSPSLSLMTHASFFHLFAFGESRLRERWKRKSEVNFGHTAHHFPRFAVIGGVSFLKIVAAVGAEALRDV
jgi:hypothetical protein